MLLFIDTETNGMINRKLPTDHPSQPRLVQLGAFLDAGDGTHIRSLDYIILPEGWTIPHDVAEIHGITTAKAHHVGKPIDFILPAFVEMIETAFDADPDSLVIAHNFSFDVMIMLNELSRTMIPVAVMNTLRPFCTMEALTPIMQMPGRYGKFKWPKLMEAYQFCFGRDFDNAHSAMADVLACREIYFHGRTTGWWK
jgi:DNA polymerase-3 subunit epsilon